MTEITDSRRFKYFDTIFYFITTYFLYPIFKIYHRAEGAGIRNIPRKGPFIVIANHACFFDPWYLGVTFRARYVRCFVTNKWYKKNKLWTFFFDLYGCVPATPENMEPSSIKLILKILQYGGAIVIFPEGRVSDDGILQEFKPGAVYIAMKAKVPIIPVAICGSHEIMARNELLPKPSKLKIVVGEAIDVSNIASGKQKMKDACMRETQKIKDWIAEQLKQFENRKHSNMRGKDEDRTILMGSR